MILFLALFLYLFIYTWNLRTGVLDRLAGHTGLEFVGLTLKPGDWASEKLTAFWKDYVSLIGVREENRVLRDQVDALKLELDMVMERAKEATRLKELMHFSPPRTWYAEGARIISHRLGPNAALDTVLLDKGLTSDVEVGTPIITPDGVVGSILKKSLHFSVALLITDPSSKISVMGRESRTPGILAGQGPDEPLKVDYVHQNARVSPGEILITSGLDGKFPKGLPAAVVTDVRRSDISLFQEVIAEPLVNLKMLEEVLLLMGGEPVPQSATVNATAQVNATAAADGAQNATNGTVSNASSSGG